MLSKEFSGKRTAYSSNSMFIAILSADEDAYDLEAIGEQIFPDGFGCITPPGPSGGFGEIQLSEDEEDGKITIDTLKSRIDKGALKSSLKEHFDGFFVIDGSKKQITQVDFKTFLSALDDSRFHWIQLVEFEPD